MKQLTALVLASALAVVGCAGSGTPSPSPCASVSPITSSGPLLEPGVARLAGGRGCVADGVRGSWTLDGTSFESPWIPASELEKMTMTHEDLVLIGWADSTPIAQWSARVAKAEDTAGATAEFAGDSNGFGEDFVTIGRMSPGEWVLEVTLVRADGRGEATYYWAISANLAAGA